MPVRLWRLLPLLLLTGACAAPLGDTGSQDIVRTPLSGGIAEFRVISYDGGDLRGRLLLEATVDTLVIDGRLFEDSKVELEKARACGTTEVREHIIVDRFAPPRPEDIITLHRGHWYGKNVRFFLWDKKTDLGPDCLEAELVVSALSGRVAATLPIRVVRTDKPVVHPDGAAEE